MIGGVKEESFREYAGRPLAAGPDDGVIRQGAMALVRDESDAERRLVPVDDAELDPETEEAAIDAPVGRALLSRRAGDRVAVRTPGVKRTAATRERRSTAARPNMPGTTGPPS